MNTYTKGYGDTEANAERLVKAMKARPEREAEKERKEILKKRPCCGGYHLGKCG